MKTNDMLLFGGGLLAAYLYTRPKTPQSSPLDDFLGGGYSAGFNPAIGGLSYIDDLFGAVANFFSKLTPDKSNYPPRGKTKEEVQAAIDRATKEANDRAQKQADAARAAAIAAGNAQYKAARAAQMRRDGWIATDNGYTRGRSAWASNPTANVNFTDIYNNNFRAAGAANAPNYNAGSIVASTIGQASYKAWNANLKAKGMSDADADRIAQWHSQRGETVNG